MSDKECKRFAGERYLTVVFKDVSRDEAYELIHHHKMSACSWSHALDDRDKARASLPVGVPDGYMPIPTAEQLADALDGVRCFHDMSAELIAPELLANLLASTTVKAEQVDDLSAEVESMVRALEEGEWAEHAGQTEIGARLESAITTLINRLPAPSLPAAGSAVEEVDVVAWQDADNPMYTTAERRVMLDWVNNDYPITPLMTVAQHERIVAALSAQQSAQPEFCCELSYKAAKQKAWDARRIDRCKCDHTEYCDYCWPADFRPGGKWHGKFVAQQSAHVSVPREWLDAVKELFDAKQAKEDFERENPGNSTKCWDACLYRIEAAEDALRALLNGGEV